MRDTTYTKLNGLLTELMAAQDRVTSLNESGRWNTNAFDVARLRRQEARQRVVDFVEKLLKDGEQ